MADSQAADNVSRIAVEDIFSTLNVHILHTASTFIRDTIINNIISQRTLFFRPLYIRILSYIILLNVKYKTLMLTTNYHQKAKANN